MGILSTDLRDLVIRPTLRHLDLYSQSAENLLLGTAAMESLMGRYLRQVQGPALGIFQMEPATHADIWDNFLIYRGDLSGSVIKLTVLHRPRTEQLVWNLQYATAMCRIHYLRVPEGLPDPDDVEGLAVYWKQYYNTHLGKGTVEQFMKHYTELVEP